MDIAQEIQELIQEVVYQQYKTFTVCILELVNGAIVCGNYFARDPRFYDEQDSREQAFARAIDKVMELLSYGVIDVARASAKVFDFRRTG